MLNSLVELVTGNNNKNEGKIKLSVKCSGLKINYEYDGPKRFSENKVVEKCQFELENFEIGGECEATMSGFFKLMCGIKDAMTEAAAASSDVTKAKFMDVGAIKQKMLFNADGSLNVDGRKLRYFVCRKDEARAISYDQEMHSFIDSAKMIVVFESTMEDARNLNNLEGYFLNPENHSSCCEYSRFMNIMRRIGDLKEYYNWRTWQQADGDTVYTVLVVRA